MYCSVAASLASNFRLISIGMPYYSTRVETIAFHLQMKYV